MIVQHTTLKYGQIDNTYYHCKDFDPSPDGLLLQDVEMQFPPPGAKPLAAVVALMLIAGDTYALFECSDACNTPGHTDLTP